jgi:hypothetical protein
LVGNSKRRSSDRRFCFNLRGFVEEFRVVTSVSSRVKRPLLILLAFGIGILFTALTAALSYFASQAGAELVSEILFWPNTLMQSLDRPHNIGTTAHPLYEGTPLNVAAFFISFPVAVLVYGTAAYISLRRRQRYHGIQVTPVI